LDYLVEVKREEIFIQPSSLISKHEAYHVITNMLWIDINQDISDTNDEDITRWEVAKILSDTYNFQKNISSENKEPNSKLEQLFNKIESFAEYKQLASLIL
jgi:hypothetical protein